MSDVAAIGSREHNPTRVLIAGGGVAAMEALLGLRELVGHRVQITMLTPERQFLHRPVAVAEAFGRGEARTYELGELIGERSGAGGEIVLDALASVEAEAHVAVTATGRRVPFDILIVAMGAVPREALAGALTFRGRPDVPALRRLLDDLLEGRARSVAFVLPSERMWTLPVYELALMAAAFLRDGGQQGVEVWLVTPEEEPLELFGHAATAAITALLASRAVRVRTSARPARIRSRALMLAGAGEIFVDRVVALPRLEGPGLPGLPRDEHGFIPVDVHGRVSGFGDIYAAGDVTSYPLKQGGLASQQADAVVEAIAAQLGVAIVPRPFTPVLRGLLMTGGTPLYLRAEPHRLPRSATVAVAAGDLRRTDSRASVASGEPLWWPPSKVAGRFLASYLATARPQQVGRQLLTDRVPVAGAPVSDAEYQDAVELALLLAEYDARWGDYRSALEALDAAEALQGALTPEYEFRRRQWREADRHPA